MKLTRQTATAPPHSHVIGNINFYKNRASIPGVLCTQARNNGLRVLGGRQHDDLTIRKEAEVPVITKSAVRAKLPVEARWVKHPPVVLNVVPSSVEAIQRFLSLTDIWRLADVDTWKPFHYSNRNAAFVLSRSNISLPSKRIRGRRRNMSLQDLKGTTLVQFLPHTRAQAECQIPGSLDDMKAPIDEPKSTNVHTEALLWLWRSWPCTDVKPTANQRQLLQGPEVQVTGHDPPKYVHQDFPWQS